MMRYLLIFLLSLVQGVQSEETPTTLVVFGATGDLTHRKVLPAVDQLDAREELPASFALVGVARRTEEAFRQQLKTSYPIHYSQTPFEGDYSGLKKLLGRIDADFGQKSRKIYFLATRPNQFSLIVEKLSREELLSPGDRVVVEKPFGTDVSSALALQDQLTRYLKEEQIYRIDHYLGKEGMLNLLQLRQQGDLESVWNRNHIDHVAITLSEEMGIGSRADFWEETGTLRDVVQNHVMQLLALVAMEPGALEEEKVKVMQAIQPIDVETVHRAQYGPGIIQGKEVIGYKEEKGVLPTSQSETYVATTLYIDNDRWEGVPFHIEAGKRMDKQLTEVTVTFKSGRILHLRIQPDPTFAFEDEESLSFEQPQFSEAYQKLIYDVMQGDRSSFVQNEEVIASWRLFTPVLQYWQTNKEIPTYPAGSP